MREKWTDERLDDLNEHLSTGFARLDADLREVRSEIARVRSDLGSEIASVRSDLCSEIASVRSDLCSEITGVRSDLKGEIGELRSEMNVRFESMQRLILQVGGGLFGTMLIGFVSLLAASH